MREFNRGYSPDIAGELEIHGTHLELSSIGPDWMTVRMSAAMPRGTGLVHLTIDGQVTTHKVELPDGIDPQRLQQRYRVVETVDATRSSAAPPSPQPSPTRGEGAGAKA